MTTSDIQGLFCILAIAIFVGCVYAWPHIKSHILKIIGFYHFYLYIPLVIVLGVLCFRPESAFHQYDFHHDETFIYRANLKTGTVDRAEKFKMGYGRWQRVTD